MEINLGTIKTFQGSWGSGLATLVITDSKTGKDVAVACDNGATARALDCAFGCIAPNHCIDNEAIKGQEIFWTLDDFGLCLGGFVPVDEAPPELWDQYENQGQ